MRKITITNILTGGYFMQTTTTKVKEALPITAKLTTTEWRVIVTHGEYTRFGKSCASIAFAPGTLGYARRNKKQTDYIQVVAHTTKGTIGSWYISEIEAERLLTVARIAPKQDGAQRAWEAGWMQYF
jgi:carbamate kinase